MWIVKGCISGRRWSWGYSAGFEKVLNKNKIRLVRKMNVSRNLQEILWRFETHYRVSQNKVSPIRCIQCGNQIKTLFLGHWVEFLEQGTRWPISVYLKRFWREFNDPCLSPTVSATRITIRFFFFYMKSCGPDSFFFNNFRWILNIGWSTLNLRY